MLPYDIIETISDIWPGRGLHLTCHRLLARADATKFLIAHTVCLDTGRSRACMATTMRLPDGTFHGMSEIRKHSDTIVEHIHYKFGQFVRMDFIKKGELSMRDFIIGGYRITWNQSGLYSTLTIDINDTVIKSYKDVPSHMAEEITRGWILRHRLVGTPPDTHVQTYFPAAPDIFPHTYH